MSRLKIGLIGLAAASLLGASAAEASVTSGEIARINAPARTITLRHHVFHLSGKLTPGSLKAGERVRVTYHWMHGHRIATRVAPLAA